MLLAAAAPAKPRVPASVGEVISAIRSYNAEETKLLAAEKIKVPELTAHWQKLAALHEGLLRLERRGVLKHVEGSERIRLRHELADLLSSPAEVSEDRLNEAAEERTRNLVGIAAIADRTLEFEIKQILGHTVAGDES